MRRILNDKYHLRASAIDLANFVAALVVLLNLCSTASSQTRAQQIAPTATGLQASPVSSAMAMQYGGQQYRTVSAAAVQNAGNVNASEVDSGVELASSLATARQNRRRSMYNPPPFNPCKTGCDVSAYASYEALWLDRRGDRFFSLSRGGFIDSGFDFEFGGRYTLGRLFDCVNGFEAVFVGPYDWTRTGVNAGRDSTLSPGGIFSNLDVSGFNNATSHSQTWEAEMYSIELNRKWWVWDVLSTMIGTRYLNYEEDYSFVSSGAGGQGLLLESVDNKLAGVQIGAELLYPTSLRMSAGIRGKAGVYANFDQRRSFVRNNNLVVVNSGDSSVDIAGIIEMSMFSSYYITPSIRLNGGYEFWYLPGIATVPEQVPGSITQNSGTSVSNDDSLFLHGVSFGATMLF